MRRLLASLCFLAISASGCGLFSPSSDRDVGQHFADALEGRSDTTFETYLSPDATIYLQGGADMSAQAFREYVERMKSSQQLFHRMSQVYLTPNGAGWLLAITRGSTPAAPTLWMEASVTSGHVTRAWIHFTVEALQALHHEPTAYVASMQAIGLPMPEGWAQGTPAMLAAAERYDAQASPTQLPLGPAIALIPLGLLVGVLVRRGRGHNASSSFGKQHGALLEAVRARRDVGPPKTSISVQRLSAHAARSETD